MKKITTFLVCLVFLAISLLGCAHKTSINSSDLVAAKIQTSIDENGSYISKNEVAHYIHVYNKLPKNFITKKEARKLGWKHKGTLDEVAPGKSIGGDSFGNFEKKLPVKAGVKYSECDIDYIKGERGSKRIVFSNTGSIYYCADHYKHFEKLY